MRAYYLMCTYAHLHFPRPCTCRRQQKPQHYNKWRNTGHPFKTIVSRVESIATKKHVATSSDVKTYGKKALEKI